jgi:hypothetical protein
MSGRQALAAIGLSLLVASCASVNTSPPVQILGERHIADKNYVLGQPAEAVVGGDVIRVRDFSVTALGASRVEVTDDFAFDHFAFSHKFRKGEVYPYLGTVEYQGKTYDILLVEAVGIGVLFDQDGAPFKKIIGGIGVRMVASPVFVIYDFDVPPGPHLRVQRGVAAQGHAGGTFYQILFSGITSDAMRFTYREYETSDLAKPALTQELTYPLKSREIHFKNLVIAVNSVTAERIHYTVVADGSPTTQPRPGI